MLIVIINLLDCPEKYQYERQPPNNFTDCNPVKTLLSLECTVLVPRDSTTVTVDWYWSKNISECGRNLTEEQGRFDIHISRGYAPELNTDRITTDLTIESTQTDTGYYWCQINDPSYNGVFISSNKAPVFDTGTMTICNGRQYVNLATCGTTSNTNTPSFIVCFISTQTVSPTTYQNMLTSGYNETAMSINDIKSSSSTVTITVTTVSGTTSKKSLETLTNLSSTKTDHLLDSTSTEMYTTTSLITTNIILIATSTSDNKTVADTSLNHISSTITDHDSSSTKVYTTTSLITMNIILTITSTNYMKTVANTTLNHKSSTAIVHGSTNSYSNTSNPSLTSLNTVIYSIVTNIVSTPLYNDTTVPFITNNTTLIISMSFVILLIISMLSCGVIVVIVIIKRRKTYKTNNGK